jgi:hypothetical protein
MKSIQVLPIVKDHIHSTGPYQACVLLALSALCELPAASLMQGPPHDHFLSPPLLDDDFSIKIMNCFKKNNEFYFLIYVLYTLFQKIKEGLAQSAAGMTLKMPA